MACFAVPLAEAVIISAVRAISKSSKRSAQETVKNSKVDFLQKMLYGGSFLLAVEHIYHGEVSFIPPFLTAMKTPSEIPAMLHEMATVGVGMAVLTTVAWAIGIAVSSLIKSKRGNAVCA